MLGGAFGAKKGVSEQALQIAVAHHFRQIERLTGKFTFFHVPNGGHRSKRQAALFKAMGVLAGVNDLIFLAAPQKAIFIEMKAKGGSISDNQASFHRRLKDFGFESHTVSAATPHEAIDKVNDILKGHGVL